MVTGSKPDLSSEALESLASAIRALPLPDSAGPGRDHLVRTIRSYLIPRLASPQSPLTVVFAGPTGAGKSTLINSVAAADLTATGPLRPTTMSPVVFAAAATAGDYAHLADVRCRVVPGDAPILKELTIVDTPDLDSTSIGHRAMAEALIDVADVVVFVSSALRYADRVPWEVLRRARARGAPVICVLNRMRPGSAAAATDYRKLLESEGLPGGLLVIGEHHLASGAYCIPSGSVRDLRKRLVLELDAHRLSSRNTWRRVLASVCSQTSDLIEEAIIHESEGSERSAAAVVTVPSVKPLADHHPGLFDWARRVAVSGGSRRKVARALRRLVGDEEPLAQERLRLAEALVLAYETLAGAGASSDLRLDDAEYHLLRLGVNAWLDRSLQVPSGRLTRVRGAEELVVRVASVSGAAWPFDILDGLSHRLDPDFARRVLGELTDEVSLVFERVRDRLVDRWPDRLQGEIAPARVALGAVVARFSFSDA